MGIDNLSYENKRSFTRNMFNTGSTFLLERMNDECSVEKDKRIIPIVGNPHNYEIVWSMNETILDENNQLNTNSRNIVTIENYLKSIDLLFNKDSVLFDERQTAPILFVRTVDIEKLPEIECEPVSLNQAYNDLREIYFERKFKLAKNKKDQVSDQIDKKKIIRVCNTRYQNKISSIDDGIFRWFSEFFDYAFEYSKIGESGKLTFVTTNSSDNLDVILFDYLQKDLKINFSSISDILAKDDLKIDGFVGSTNENLYVKISPVRLVRFKYSIGTEDNFHQNDWKYVCELIGSFTYNEIMSTISGLKVIDENISTKDSTFVFPSAVEMPIIGYNIEFFYKSDETNNMSVPIKGNMLKQIFNFIWSKENLKSIKLSLESDINYLDCVVGTSSSQKTAESNSLKSDSLSIRDVLYFARESQDICLCSDKLTIRNTNTVKLVNKYFKMIQKYYRDVLDVNDEGILVTPFVEYLKNYIDTLCILVSVYSAINNPEGKDGESAYGTVERIGIHLPQLIRSYMNLGSGMWWICLNKLKQDIKLIEDISNTSFDNRPFSLNRELAINYTVGCYVPMFLFDISNTKHDPLYDIKRQILSWCLNTSNYNSGSSSFDTYVIECNRNKILAFSKEMYIPRCLDNKRLSKRQYANSSVLNYNEDNTVDKVDPLFTSNVRVEDIDLLDSQGLIVDTINSPKNLIPCNISISAFIANDIRKKLSGDDWSLVKDISALPELILNKIVSEV